MDFDQNLYALILTRCRFGWLNNIFCSFSTELWSLIDVEFSFMLNILWTYRWILIKFCKYIHIDKIIFWYFSTELWPLICFHLISCEQIDGFWWNFEYAVLWLTHEIVSNFSTELWAYGPWLMLKFKFFSISLEIRGLSVNFWDNCDFVKRTEHNQNNFHSHQVLHIWDLGLNYLTASFNEYDSVAFLKTDTPTTSEHVP